MDPEVVFLNHGSFGACPRVVLAAQSALREQMESQPLDFFLRVLPDALDEARAALSEFVGADPDGLAFVTNATSGVNAVLRSLDFSAADELLTTNHAYAACANALRFVAERSGASLRVADVPFPLHDADEVVAAILDAVSPRTRFALLDHVTSATGLVLPIERLVDELEGRGIAVMVDGAHAPGMVPVDIEGLGASYYTGNCHKWLCAPKGAGFLWARADVRDAVRPLTISHGAGRPVVERSRYRMEFDWVGTTDPTPWLCVPVAIREMSALVPGGWPALMARNRGLAVAARSLLVAALGTQAPAPESMIGTLVTVPMSDDAEPVSDLRFAPHRLQGRLRRDHRTEVPVVTWPQWPGRAIRVSAQLYNGIDDYRWLARALGDEGITPMDR